MIVLGADTHKSSHTIVAVNSATGQVQLGGDVDAGLSASRFRSVRVGVGAGEET